MLGPKNLREFIEFKAKYEPENAKVLTSALADFDRYQADISAGAFLRWEKFEEYKMLDKISEMPGYLRKNSGIKKSTE
jgi:hypothetical protein